MQRKDDTRHTRAVAVYAVNRVAQVRVAMPAPDKPGAEYVA